jgi:hypothetical protein
MARGFPNTFGGVHVPGGKFDVCATSGVEGDNKSEANFGMDAFKWKEGNYWAWRVGGHVGNKV